LIPTDSLLHNDDNNKMITRIQLDKETEIDAEQQKDDHIRSHSGASMIRLLIQQQHDERRAKKKQQRLLDQEIKITDGNKNEHLSQIPNGSVLEPLRSGSSHSHTRSFDHQEEIIFVREKDTEQQQESEIPSLSMRRSNGSHRLFADNVDSNISTPPRTKAFPSPLPKISGVTATLLTNQLSVNNSNDESDDDDNDDESPLLLRQKPTKQQLQAQQRQVSVGQSSLHPNQYTQSNHVLINYERNKRSLHPLRRNVYMDTLARQHAEQMAKQQKLFHSVSTIQQLQSILSPLPSAFIAGTGSTSSITNGTDTIEPTVGKEPVFHVAENILRGNSVKAMHDDTMMQWNQSNRKNILSNHFTEFGMGTAQVEQQEDADNDNDDTTNKEPVLYMVQLFRSSPPLLSTTMRTTSE
jgi:uncharacterized protein YkwD